MDFKNSFWKLRDLKSRRLASMDKQSFCTSLLHKSSWLLDFNNYNKSEVAENIDISSEVKIKEDYTGPSSLLNNNVSEKKDLLESFSKFTKEKMEQGKEGKILFDGGEISKKNETLFEVETRSTLSNYLIKRDQFKEVKCQVLFIGEVPKDYDEEDNDLLHKMIGAMKLTPGSFIRSFIPRPADESEEMEIWNNCLSDIMILRPKAVVSLGAISTNLALGKKERLSRVHGKEVMININSTDKFFTTLFPVFHPDILNINPNMKRSAWTDLQKVMDFLSA